MLGFYKNVKHLFCAIFVFCTVFSTVNNVYADCVSTEKLTYTQLSDYYCPSKGSDPKGVSTGVAIVCTKCAEGDNAEQQSVAYSYECGSLACVGAGELDSNWCNRSSVNSLVCSPGSSGSVSYNSKMKIMYM